MRKVRTLRINALEVLEVQVGPEKYVKLLHIEVLEYLAGEGPLSQTRKPHRVVVLLPEPDSTKFKAGGTT